MKIFVRVKANASQDKVKENGNGRFEVWTKQRPLEGKANKAVLKLLAGHLKIPASTLSIASGVKSREKVVRVDED